MPFSENNFKTFLIALNSVVEETAVTTVDALFATNPDAVLSYPPNCGLDSDEELALTNIKWSPALQSASSRMQPQTLSYRPSA